MRVKTTNWKGQDIETPLQEYIKGAIGRAAPAGELEALTHEVNRLTEIVAILLAERVKTQVELNGFGIYLTHGEELICE